MGKRGLLYMRFKGRTIATGITDTLENRRFLAKRLDELWMRHKLDGINMLTGGSTATISIEAAWREFELLYLPAKTPKTSLGYHTAYRYFFSGTPSLPLTKDSLTKTILYRITAEANPQEISRSTYLRCIKVFIRWTYAAGYLSKLPDFAFITAHLRNIAPPEPETYTQEELEAILQWFKEHAPDQALLCELVMLTGWRIHEAMELRVEQIRDDHILLTSKDGRRHERYPIWAETRALFDTLKSHKPVDDQGHVFTWWSQHRYRGLLDLLTQAMRELNIPKRGRAWHEMRKTFISRMARSGMPLDQASKIARCGIPTMMKYYRAFTTEELASSLEKMARQERKERGKRTT